MSPHTPSAVVIAGDCRHVLPTLESGSVQCVVTSPTYWYLRDFGHPDQMGLERTVEEYVEALVGVFREVRRVLADTGVLWLNLGDTWVTSPNSRTGWDSSTLTKPNGRARKIQLAQEASTHSKRCFPSHLRSKQLVGLPWRVAFVLQDDGWFLRSEIIWAKPAPLPESVNDRPTKAHETIFLLSKQARYFYDQDAIAEPASSNSHTGWDTIETRNKRSVWTIPPEPFHGDHTGAFPTQLAETCILAGSRPGDRVLDPFSGTGRTGRAALRHSRRYLGIELHPDFAAESVRYIRDDAPLFNTDVELVTS